MHEVDMTRALVLSLDQWRSQKGTVPVRVRQVELQVGDFTCVEPDALLLAWGTAVRGTWLESAALRIERVPLKARCLACGDPYAPAAETGFRSPCCSHPMEEILQGRELRILRVDYDASPALSSPSP